jgi:hypothetical protein
MSRGRVASGTWLIVALSFCGVFGKTLRAEATLWSWSYTGDGFAASGTITTSDTPNADGFFSITGISGSRNGEAIVRLQPDGTAIPGNDGFPVDNLLRSETPELTSSGFGYQLADGTFGNVFADFLSPQTYLEFFSDPALGTHTELPIIFSATVPEPAGLLPMLVGLFGLSAILRRTSGGACKPMGFVTSPMRRLHRGLQDGSLDSGDGRRLRAFRSAALFARRGRAAPWPCSSASAAETVQNMGGKQEQNRYSRRVWNVRNGWGGQGQTAKAGCSPQVLDGLTMRANLTTVDRHIDATRRWRDV